MKNSSTQPLSLLGKCLQPLAWVLRKQNRLVNGLVNKGFSKKLAQLTLTTLNLFILIAILWMLLPTWTIVIVLVFGVALLAAYHGVDIDVEPPLKEEWRMGWDGYGLYDCHDIRLDSDSSDDISHPKER